MTTKSNRVCTLIMAILIILSGSLRGGATLGDGLHFLFGVDKTYIGDRDLTLSRSDVWAMQNGVWCLFSIILGVVIGTIEAVKLWQMKNSENNEANEPG